MITTDEGDGTFAAQLPVLTHSSACDWADSRGLAELPAPFTHIYPQTRKVSLSRRLEKNGPDSPWRDVSCKFMISVIRWVKCQIFYPLCVCVHVIRHGGGGGSVKSRKTLHAATDFESNQSNTLWPLPMFPTAPCVIRIRITLLIPRWKFFCYKFPSKTYEKRTKR